MSRALILFAHGARDPEWARPFEALRAQMRLLLPQIPVELAYLDLMSPALPQAVPLLVAQGATHITVVPVFLAQGSHLKRDLPLIIDGIRAAHPGLAIEATPPIGEQPEVINVIAACVARIVSP